MKVHGTPLEGVLLVELDVFGDERGFFQETFHAERYAEYGIDAPFVQDNHSRSMRNVLRGLHLQRRNPQGKLVRATRGSVYDVVADVNESSPTYGQWVGFELSDQNHRQLWVPPGFAHGFCVLSEVADFEYKCTDYYHPDDEAGVRWNCPTIAVEWPVEDPIISARDSAWPGLDEFSLLDD